MIRFGQGVSAPARRVGFFLVGWQLASHMRAELVVDALQMALGTRKHLGHVELVHHSDSEYVGAGCLRRSDPHSDRRERMRGLAADRVV